MAVKVTPERGSNGKPSAPPPPAPLPEDPDIYSDLYDDDLDEDDLDLELASPRKARSNGTGPKTFIGLLGGKKGQKPPPKPPAPKSTVRPRPGPKVSPPRGAADGRPGAGTPKSPAKAAGPDTAGTAGATAPASGTLGKSTKPKLSLFGGPPTEDEGLPEEKGFFRKHGQYYIINLIVVVILGFFATMMLLIFVFSFSGVSAELPDFAAHMVPNHGGDPYLALAAGTVACVAAFFLHYIDRKRNLLVGTAVTGVILGGLGLQIAFPNPGLSAAVIV
ncbi:MAG: hypothetical protein ACRD1X_15315, partial [Vicinamibacteria bacterium]